MPSSPVVKRQPPSPISPSNTLQQDAFREPSSPSHRANERNQRRQRKGQERRTGLEDRMEHGTFLEDGMPAETARHNNDDGEDPHDLSFSPKHVPRASMVDNMVMSLDQFSNPSSANVYDDFSHYTVRSKTMGTSRIRGHTFSSSVSSEGDAREERAWPQLSAYNARVNRRASNSKFPRQKLPIIFGEDEDTARTRAYDSQRAMRPPKVLMKKSRHGKEGKGSTSSSVDLSHLSGLRLGPAGNRRSQSFDFGSRRPNDLVINAPDPIDVAPVPVVFAGPEAQSSPVKETFGTLQIARRNSTKSSKSAYTKKGKTGTLGTSTIRQVNSDQAPAMPSMRSSPALSNVLSEGKTTPSDSPAGPRPGFFRRVFGTTKIVPAPDTGTLGRSIPHGRSTPVRDQEAHTATTPPPRLRQIGRRVSTDVSINKENQPVVVKKASFFRRRKKSVSNTAPPPLPLTLAPHNTMNGEPSPVSSLRALMDPYLADTQAGSVPPSRMSDDQLAYHTAQNTPQLAEASLADPSKRKFGDEIPNLVATNRPKATIPDSRQSSRLRVPHHDSFLADSSSTDEPSKNSSRPSTNSNEPAAENPTTPVESIHKVPSNNSSVANMSLRPNVPARKESWNTEASATSASRNDTVSRVPKKVRPHLDIATSEDRLKPSGFIASPTGTKEPASASDTSEYRSAPSTPLLLDDKGKNELRQPSFHVSHPSVSEVKTDADETKARQIFDNSDPEVEAGNASAWLGETGSERERVRKEYMELFDWSGLNILAAMRALCDRIALKGETQQVDRVLDAFAQRWCECNANHGFKSSDVVHTICYSLLLLNTDLHLADIGQKMTRAQFIRNALPTIKRVGETSDVEDSLRAPSPSIKSPTTPSGNTPRRPSIDQDGAPTPALGRPIDRLTREDSGDLDGAAGTAGLLVDAPYVGSERGWESQIETVLKTFYASISRQRLPLFGAPVEDMAAPSSGGLLSMTSTMLRRTPSTLSKTQPDTLRGRVADNRSLGNRWASKTRSRPRWTPNAGFGSSRTSLDEQSSGWSPSMSSTWSKASLGKTLTSVSVDSFGSENTRPDYQSSIGFANALSQAIIREDQIDLPLDEGLKAAGLLEDETLELSGAPWAKEGIMKHKCHLEGVDKRSKDRNWTDCFAVIEKGWMRLFSFSMNAKSMRQKAKNQKATGVVGGGNWQDNAEEIWKFMLRHTIASSLPPPGYSKARPYVWALSLPTGAVHLFSVGTPDIVKEFVSSANYWSARLSKEPMMGGISNMEYGWSDVVVNRALLAGDSQPVLNRMNPSPRPSTQMSMRSSIDYGVGAVRPKLPGDKVHISDWVPPQQSMMASQLMEVDQLKGLQTYVKNVEDDLQKHNELRAPMLLAFTTRHPNSQKAMSNWEKKSSYLLREIVKFRTYIDALQGAQGSKERVLKMRKEEEEARRQEDDSAAMRGTI